VPEGQAACLFMTLTSGEPLGEQSEQRQYFVRLTAMETPPASRTATLTFQKNSSKMTLIDKTANLRDRSKLQVGLA
jgi:hypothetical protein